MSFSSIYQTDWDVDHTNCYCMVNVSFKVFLMTKTFIARAVMQRVDFEIQE